MALAAPFPAARGELRLTRRGKAVLASGAVLAAVAIAALGGQTTAQAGDAPSQAVSGSVVVKPGESLWQIAQRIAPGQDPRAMVLRLREINGLGDSVVVAGQALVVPVG